MRILWLATKSDHVNIFLLVNGLEQSADNCIVNNVHLLTSVNKVHLPLRPAEKTPAVRHRTSWSNRDNIKNRKIDYTSCSLLLDYRYNSLLVCTSVLKNCSLSFFFSEVHLGVVYTFNRTLGGSIATVYFSLVFCSSTPAENGRDFNFLFTLSSSPQGVITSFPLTWSLDHNQRTDGMDGQLVHSGTLWTLDWGNEPMNF